MTIYLPDLRVTLLQTNLFWENPTANLAMLEEKILGYDNVSDLIVLPEMFTTGFTMNPAPFAEVMGLATTRWLQQMAAQTNAVVTGSFIVREGTVFRNRLVWVAPDGSIDFYDKRHLFSIAGEDRTYTRGERKSIKNIKGWKICPLICYDLRFPVWARNVGLNYDLLLFVANWPTARYTAWQTLLAARAIENQCYVAGVNRVGEDANGIAYSGGSGVVDFNGAWMSSPQSLEFIHTFTLKNSELSTHRINFSAHLDADLFTLS